jgi:hypothetical protein
MQDDVQNTRKSIWDLDTKIVRYGFLLDCRLGVGCVQLTFSVFYSFVGNDTIGRDWGPP